MPPRFRSPPPDSAQDRPCDFLRTPGPRLSAVPAVECAPAPHIPPPPEPWAQDARDAPAKLHVVPAFEARVPERAAFVPAAMARPTTRGIHRPRTTPRTWAAVALLAALLTFALVIGTA